MNDINKYIENIEKVYLQINDSFINLLTMDYDMETYKNSNDILKKSVDILTILNNHTVKFKKLIEECKCFNADIKDLLIEPKPYYVFHTSKGMLSYEGKDFIREIIPKKETINPIITIKELNYPVKISTISHLQNLPEAFHYYRGDRDNPEGIYIRLLNNNIARIPFPDIIDAKKDFERKNTIKCKFGTTEECNNNKNRFQKGKSCNFAHVGDKITKICYPSRCNTIPNIGNPETFYSDIRKINYIDGKNLLLYGLNDVMISSLWFSHNMISGKIMNNLEYHL
jgi:hypothetical protein